MRENALICLNLEGVSESWENNTSKDLTRLGKYQYFLIILISGT